MTPEQVVDYFGKGIQAVAAAELEITPQRLNNWIARKWVPLDWQIWAHHESGGRLKLSRKKPNGKDRGG